MEIKEFCDNHDIEYIEEDGEIWMKTHDVGNYLGLSNIRENLRSIPDECKTKRQSKTRIGEQFNCFINEEGLKQLIRNSRKKNCKDVANDLGYDIYGYHIVRKETATIDFIKTVYKNERMKEQKQFDNYFVDLYFPDYKIVVECDEAGHYSERKRKEDEKRQKYLEKKYGVIFVRYDIDKNDNSLAKCIRKINKIIYN